MGGKTSTSTSQVSIPPEVLARYNSVNAQAQSVAATPFQQYSTDPSSFVQPLTPTQTAGIENTNAAQGMAQPYYNAATGFALAGAGPVNAQPLNTSAYMNPYLNTVLGSTEAMVNQQNQQAMSGQTGNAMSQGYFGGDRAGIAAAVLAGQQQLTGGQLYSGIASDAYNQAMAAAQQQQATQLGAAQANRAALTGAGEQLAGLGTTAQQTALAGAQAQLGAGQVEQQTGQAGLTALYNQFLQQQSYPFQVAQFLANIAEGTGALSGSTTTTTQPQSIFSDERLKEDMVPVGVGFDGANIYRFRYRGDPTVRVGFSAQETARLHPEAVSIHPSGFLMVDYGRATDAAAGFARAANDNGWEPEPRRMRAAGGRAGYDGGGLTLPQPWGAEAGAIENYGKGFLNALGVHLADGGRAGFDAGGMAEWGSYPSGTNPMAISQILQAQAQMYGPYSQAGLYGGQGASGGPYGGVQGHVPSASLPVGQLMIAHAPPAQQQGNLGTAIHDVANLADDAEGLKSDYHMAHQGFDWLTGHHGSSGGGDDVPFAKGGRIGRAPGGLTAADYAAQAHQYMNEAKLHAAAAAAHRDIAQRQAADRYKATHPDTSFGARGTIIGSIPGVQGARAAIGLAPQVYHGIHQELDTEMQRRAAADDAAQASLRAGMAGIGNWAGNQQWAHLHQPGWKPTAPWNTDPRAYLHPNAPTAPAAPPAAARPAPAAPAAAPAAPPRDTSSYFGSAADHALRAAQHQHLANQHRGAAQAAQAAGDPSLSAPTAAPTGRASPNLSGEAGIGLPTNTGAPAIPINVGDVSHLQTGFAPANLTPYHEGLFQRAGDWLAGHFGSDAQRMAYDARGLTPDNSGPAPIQSEAFQGAQSAAAAPVLAQAAPASTEPIQSQAFDPATHPVALKHDVDVDPQLAARGGFARADGGAASNPWNAAASGSSNLASARASRQDGGELSDPHNDDPYKPQGPGLNIPTEETQHPKLATAQPVGGGQQGGLGQAVGMASDLANIGKFAMMFAANGGRIGYDDGGPVPDDDTLTPKAPLHNAAETPDAAAADAPAPPTTQPQPGFGGAAQPPPEHQGFLPSLFHGVEHLGEGIAGMAGYEGGGHWNKDRLFPLLSAIGAAGSVPTVHPLVALAAGLGGYGKAYMGQQQAEAQLAQTQATAGQTRFQTLPPSLQKGMVEADGPALDPTTHQIDWKNTHMVPGVGYKHWEMATNMLPSAGLGSPGGGGGGGGGPQAGVVGSPGSAGAGQMTGPVMADYSGGGRPRYTIGPSSTTGQKIAQQYGIDPNGSRMGNEMLAMAKGPDEAHRAAAQKVADDYVAGGGEVATDQSNFRAMVDEAAKLPNTGLGAVGPGQGERQLLLNAVNTWGKAIIPGFQGFSDVDQNSSATELLHKLSTIQSDALANKYGQRSLQAAQDLKSVMPGGDLQKATIYGITSQMMIANERMLNFNEYRNAYQQLGLGDVGLLDAYDADTADMYAKQRALLPKMMANGMFQYLEKNPSELKRVEQGYDTTDANGKPIHVNGLGPGFGKLFE